MGNRYKPRKIKNLHDLRIEQIRVRNAYRNMELNWIQNLLSPEVLLTTAVQSLLSPSSSKKKPESGKKTLHNLFSKRNKQKKQARKNTTMNNLDNTSSPKKHKTKKSYKKLGKQLLIWQTASLAAFIGTNLFVYFRNKKKEKQANSER